MQGRCAPRVAEIVVELACHPTHRRGRVRRSSGMVRAPGKSYTRRWLDVGHWVTHRRTAQPDRGKLKRTIRRSKAICGRCLVRFEWLAFALTYAQIDGMWGSISQRERRQLRLAAANAKRPSSCPPKEEGRSVLRERFQVVAGFIPCHAYRAPVPKDEAAMAAIVAVRGVLPPHAAHDGDGYQDDQQNEEDGPQVHETPRGETS
jgi:hypothetical protein